MSSENIKTLVRQSQNGDADSFGKLYSLYSTDMYRFAYYQTSSKILAEDAVSEAVLLAFQKIRQLKKIDSFKSWLFTILLNCCRKQQKEKAVSLKISQLDDVANTLYIEQDYSENIALKKSLRMLNEDEREIFLLANLFGYTSREIGELTGLKSTTVRSRLSRTTEKMKKLLNEEGA